MQPAAVLVESDEASLAGNLGQTTELEAGEAESSFDDAEDGYDGLLAVGIASFGIGGFEFGQHDKALGLGDAARRLGLGWRPDIVSAVRLGPADGDLGLARSRGQVMGLAD
jgi:hypothetical protein